MTDSGDKGSTANRDEDLENSAILFQNASSIEDGCGHAVPWESMVDRVHGNGKMECPVCQAHVGMIRDIVTSTATNQIDSTTICFKYGKVIFQLSTKVAGDATTASQSSGISSIASGLLGSSTRTNTAADGTTMLAKDRIAQALDLDPKRLKILHKGKIMYPPSATTAAQQSPASISDEIRKISQQDLGMKDDKKTKHTRKVSLVVVGSRKEEGNNNDGSSLWKSLTNITTSIIKLPYTIVTISVQTAWLFASSILDPFLPERLRLTRGGDDRHEHEE